MRSSCSCAAPTRSTCCPRSSCAPRSAASSAPPRTRSRSWSRACRRAAASSGWWTAPRPRAWRTRPQSASAASSCARSGTSARLGARVVAETGRAGGRGAARMLPSAAGPLSRGEMLENRALHDVGPFGNNVYLITDPTSRETAIVDVGFDPEQVIARVARERLAVRWLLATHAHYDHVAAMLPVQQAVGGVFALHPADLPLLAAIPEQGSMFGLPP